MRNVMCSLSSTLRYCCVGPAPFDDIGDIPYHDSRVIQPSSSHKSPDAPHLPRLPSAPNTIRIQGVPVPPALATPPDKCCPAASEVKEGTGCRKFDGRRVEGACPPVTHCLHGKFLAVSEYGSRCVVDGCGNGHQHKCSANHSHIVQSLNNNPFTPNDCPCQHHQNEARLQDSGHRSHNLNNHSAADYRLQNYQKDYTFNRRYFGDDCHDDINMNNHVRPGSSPSLEDTINLDQQRSHYLVPAASSNSHEYSLEETDSSCETLIIWSEQMNRNTRRHNARQRSSPLGTVTLLAEWSHNTMSFSHSAASPSSTPSVGFPRYAWEESKQTIQTTAVPVEFPRYAWDESEQIIQTTAAIAGVDRHGWRFCFVQPISLIPEHVINDQ